MVLKPSDYSLPKPGETMNPMNPTNFLTRLIGMIAVLSVVAFAWEFAQNRGVSFIDRTAGSLTGGLLSSTGESGGGPWDGV